MQPLSILLAEDNPVNPKVGGRLLEKLGHSVVLVSNGADALEAAAREDFDAILMDIQMPVMDGYDATRAIRARERNTGGHIPVIARTAHAMKGDREVCLDAGMDDYLTKPIQSRDLRETLGRWTDNVNADLVRTGGVSLELLLQLPARIDLESSLEIQRSVFGSGGVLPNSPGQVGKLHLSIPLWRDRLSLGAGMQTLGPRGTYAGATVPWVILPEAVLSTKPLAAGLQFSAGIKNLSNSFYRDPAGLTPTVDSVIGSGRTYYLNVTWHSAERDSDPKGRDRPGQSGNTMVTWPVQQANGARQ